MLNTQFQHHLAQALGTLKPVALDGVEIRSTLGETHPEPPVVLLSADFPEGIPTNRTHTGELTVDLITSVDDTPEGDALDMAAEVLKLLEHNDLRTTFATIVAADADAPGIAIVALYVTDPGTGIQTEDRFFVQRLTLRAVLQR